MSYGDVLGAAPTSDLRVGGFVAEAIAQFADAVLYGRPVLATGEDGVAATRVVEAIDRSAKTGQPVAV
jgi:predicted dehydrogenase